MSEPTFKVNCLFGYVKINSWLMQQGGKMIGMGSATTYNAKGEVVSYKSEPTGLVLTYK